MAETFVRKLCQTPYLSKIASEKHAIQVSVKQHQFIVKGIPSCILYNRKTERKARKNGAE